MNVNKFSDTTVVIPTFNEEGNIRVIINKIKKAYPGISIIVADDGSKDNTREIVKSIGKKDRSVRLLDRGKEKEHGIAASVIDSALIAKTGKLVVIDADLQHPVEKVGDIARELDRYDIVVGVRTKVSDWGLDRRIISAGMFALAYVVFKIKGKHTTRDMMSGFFGVKTKVFQEVIKRDRGKFVGKGYKILLDLLRLVDKRNTTLSEVPYETFHKRIAGESKLSKKHMVYTLMSTFK